MHSGPSRQSSNWCLAFLVVCRRIATLRCITYNPLTATDPVRAEEISYEFANYDIVALAGTGIKWAPDDDVSTTRLPHHVMYRWGYGKGKLSNKACGVAFLIKSVYRLVKT